MLFMTIDFWVITVICNFGAIAFAMAFYHFELAANPNVTEFSDSIWWSFVTLTSVGYGDITPVTREGRIVGVLLMIFGTGVFATYTAIFANILLGGEFTLIGRKVKMLKRNVEGMQTDMHREDLMLERELNKLNKTLNIINDRLTGLEERNGDKK